MPLSFFSILLKDAAALLRSSTVVELPHQSMGPQKQPNFDSQTESKVFFTSANELLSHPSAHALLALSDLSALFTADSPSTPRPAAAGQAKRNHVAHKLTFYAAYILGVPPILLRTLVAELTERAESVTREGVSSVGERTAAGEAAAPGGQRRDTKIVELS